ncbi:hypothetical protein OUZ56_032179 [Daphnia magna]|uniref:Regulatory protein zeste n=1 Tax=Daphnia magna TaxID=35525 RepID=A0ABQ9ZWR0_9CRUS|nr:hypothetical protein OUZ56_032179 [Daphnia magna]
MANKSNNGDKNNWSNQQQEILVFEFALRKAIILNFASILKWNVLWKKFGAVVTKDEKKKAWDKTLECILLGAPTDRPKTIEETETNKALSAYRKSITGTGGGPQYTLKPLYVKIIENVFGEKNPALSVNFITGGIDTNAIDGENYNPENDEIVPMDLPTSDVRSFDVENQNDFESLSGFVDANGEIIILDPVEDGAGPSTVSDTPSRGQPFPSTPVPRVFLAPVSVVPSIPVPVVPSTPVPVVHSTPVPVVPSTPVPVVPSTPVPRVPASDNQSAIPTAGLRLAGRSSVTPLSLRETQRRAKRLACERSEVYSSKRICLIRLEVLKSVMEVRALRLEPKLTDAQIPEDLLGLINNPREAGLPSQHCLLFYSSGTLIYSDCTSWGWIILVFIINISFKIFIEKVGLVSLLSYAMKDKTCQNNPREGRRGDGHIGQGWLPVQNFVDTDGICVEPLIAMPEISVQFPIRNYNIFANDDNSSPHLESNTDLQHHIQKGYTYAIDNDVNIHRQLEHKLNCFGKQHYQAQALNFQLSFKKTHHPGGCKNVLTYNLP